MPITEDRISKLREFGLSEYAARAYLALLDLGVTEARDISKLTKVPTSKIYHVLDQLHERGLVQIIPEFPKKYGPIPFSDYLDKLLREHEQAARAIWRDRDDLADMFRFHGDVEIGDRGNFNVVRGRRNVLAKIEEALALTRAELFIIATPGMSARFEHFSDAIDDLKRRGVRMRFLVPLTKQTLPRFASLTESAEVRARNLEDDPQSGHVAMIIADGARCLLINFIPDDENLYAGRDIGIYTDQEAMVSALQLMVEPLWSRAATFEDRRGEIEHGHIPEFTRFYSRQEQVHGAFREALARGVASFRYMSSTPAEVPNAGRDALLAAVAASGASARVILNLQDVETAERYGRLGEESPDLEVRHMDPGTYSRFMVFDEREAIFSAARPQATTPEGPEGAAASDDFAVHTSNLGTVRSLHEHFDELWEAAVPAKERHRELARFPHLHPRDIGIGHLFDRVGDGVVVVDPDGRIVLWNHGAGRIFGLPQEKAFERSILDLLAERERERYAEALRRFREGGQLSFDAGVFELVGLDAQGREIHLEATLSPLQPGDGARFVILLARDVTERRAAEALLAATLESSADGILVVDLEGRILRRNRRFSDLWGIPEDVLASGLDDEAVRAVLDRVEDPEAFARRVRQLESAPEEIARDTVRLKDGRLVERYSTPYLVGGRIVGRVVSFRDITERAADGGVRLVPARGESRRAPTGERRGT